MKKTLLICGVSLIFLAFIAQETTKRLAPKYNIEHSFLWGLFKSENYAKEKTVVVEFENPKVASTAFPTIDTTKYEEKSVLWGAIKWTEKKSETTKNSTTINPTQIQGIDTTKPLKESFAFMADEIGDARVVALGEQTHSPDVSFEIRAKLIEYLIENQGFEVVLFEAGMFDLHVASKNLKKTKDIADLQNALYSFWGKTEYHNQLFNYLQNKLTADQSIEFAGFDCKLTSRPVATTNIYTEMLREALKAANIDSTLSEYKRYIDIWQKIEENRKKGGLHSIVYPMTAAEKDEFLALSTFFQQKLKAAGNTLWSRMLHGIDQSIAMYSDFTMEKAQSDPALLLRINNKRDQLMANHLEYLLTEVYKNKKIILIGANYHFVRNVAKITPSNVAGLDFAQSITMGQLVQKTINENIFTIGFMAPEKYNCNTDENALGCLQQQAGYSVAYHPLHKWNLNEEDATQQQIIKLFMPQSPSKHPNWNEVIDAVVFINKAE
jgi:erythromycin esterase-like protein